MAFEGTLGTTGPFGAPFGVRGLDVEASEITEGVRLGV